MSGANGKPSAVGGGILRQQIEAAASAEHLSMNALTVLSAQRDPYRLDTPAGHKLGQWFAEHVRRMVPPERNVHLRGFHYLLISASRPVLKVDGTPYVNTDDDWTWLTEKAAKCARWLGYVAFDRIRDERNEPPELFSPNSFSSSVRDARQLAIHPGESLIADLPRVKRLLPYLSWRGSPVAPRQPFRIVLIGEKSSLGDVLRPIASEVGGELLLPTGEATDSMIAAMAGRADADGRLLVVLYFSDFDPAGHQMPVSVARKLQGLHDLCYPYLQARVFPVALSLDQVVSLDLPSSPLKATEQRADGWRAATGREQTEIDSLAALRPDVLDQIARDFVTSFYDFTLDRRTEAATSRWFRDAGAWLRALPVYAEAVDALTKRHSAVTEAVADFDNRKRQALRDLERALSEADDAPEPPTDLVLNIKASAPEPLFSTEDDHAAASRKLIAHKSLADMAGEARQ